jgi:hypothetical protein
MEFTARTSTVQHPFVSNCPVGVDLSGEPTGPSCTLYSEDPIPTVRALAEAAKEVVPVLTDRPALSPVRAL